MTRGPEDVLQRQVLDLCRQLHLLTAHFRTALTATGRHITAVAGDGKGFPDLTIVGPGGVLFRELKSPTGSTSLEQRRWLAALTEAGANAAVWKPRDMASGRIVAELQAIRRPSNHLTGVS